MEPFLLASSLVGVLAQRLVRVLCPDCREQAPADSFECQFLGIDYARAPQLYRPVGCEGCSHSGYRGRTGIYELINVDDALRERIHDRSSEQDLTRLVRKTSPSIREDGRRKVLAGETTVQEVLRVTLEE
jgi:general secretion pathway protein E